jgi:DNA polymerase III alpha subunit
MNYDRFGQAYVTSNQLCDLLYQQPDLDLARFLVEDCDQYNSAVKSTYAVLPIVTKYHPLPDDYSEDIAQWLLDQCCSQEELQRVGKELLLYQDRNLFPLLKQLKYIVDTWRTSNIVWGVGRGSSVASYVLYLIGVHRINSIYYDLDIEEFLR